MSAVELMKESITEEDLKDYLIRLGAVNLRKVGDVYRSTCPIHHGHNDTTFTFNPEKKLFNCFSECGGGDIFDLVALANDLDIETEFAKVVQLTAKEFSIDISNIDLKDITYHYKKETLDYLRYLSGKKEVFNDYYDISVLGNRYALNEYRGLDKMQLLKNNVSFANDLNRICFEIKNDKGVTIGASLRAVGNESPKWLHRPKRVRTGMLLYNLHNVLYKGFREVIIVEGILDCLNLVKQGIENVVCTFGDRVTEEQRMILVKHFDTVVLAFDNDVAGIKAKNKQIEKLRKIINTKVLIYDTKDPGELDLSKDSISIVEWYEYKENVV